MNRSRAAWVPDQVTIDRANVTTFATEQGLDHYDALYDWSVAHPADFWGKVVDRLGIVFDEAPSAVLGEASTLEHPVWFPDARLNIVASCFTAPPERDAIIHRRNGALHHVSYARLRTEVGRVVAGLIRAGIDVGDRVAIAMPMNVESVYAYLGIVAHGAVVVSIADSFAPDEIAMRLDLTDASLVITQDETRRGDRTLPMYDKVRRAGAERCVVVGTAEAGPVLAAGDISWEEFAGAEPVDAANELALRSGPPGTHTNILFSSGTTGEPKAIPWTQLTPVKAAMDGFLHHDIHPGDVVAWPTNLGWMMGPWLIYASLINEATMVLHDDLPSTRDFGETMVGAGVTMLGLVPSLVSAWRASGCMEGLDWTALRTISSTGEASNPDDMRYLISLTGVPVLEYCGGTELGGGYLAATMVHPCVPGTFTTPTLGTGLRILDESGNPATTGEVFIVPPGIGQSLELLNRNHHDVYFADTPGDDGAVLRRHGDHIEQLPDGSYRALGRVDDTMNLGGIKVSSAELERTVATVDGVAEVAAIAVSPSGGGPSRLVVYAVPLPGVEPDPGVWREAMQTAIRTDLNPLFKIHDVVAVASLPRTASAKVMRRTLRDRYDG